MSINLSDIATLIWKEELNETDQTTIPEVAYWLKNIGIGQLNDLIFTNFTIDETTQEILPTGSFGLEELGILVTLYFIKYFKWQSNNFLGAVGINDVIEYNEAGMSIRKLNRNEISKTFLSLMKEAKDELKNLVNGYQRLKAVPKDISGEEVLFISTYTPRYNRILNQGL